MEAMEVIVVETLIIITIMWLNNPRPLLSLLQTITQVEITQVEPPQTPYPSSTRIAQASNPTQAPGAATTPAAGNTTPAPTSASNTGQTPPPQASAAGFSNLVRDDEFTKMTPSSGVVPPGYVDLGNNGSAQPCNCAPKMSTSELSIDSVNGLGISLDTSGGNANATGDEVTTTTSYDHGYFEAMIKWPPGCCTWAAFWGAVGNGSGTEIDWPEFNDSPNTGAYWVCANGCSGPGPSETGFNCTPSFDMTAGFHKYGILWRIGQPFRIYIDDVQINGDMPLPQGYNNAAMPISFMTGYIGNGGTQPTIATNYIQWFRIWQ
jgi:Glycosyl hydrolases family 16